MDRKEAIEVCAKAAHEVNRVFCEGLGDTSQKPWGEAEEWQKKASREGVKNIFEGKIDGSGQMHEEWAKDKVKDGWTYGPVKDSVKKTHPSLVPFEELSFPEQAKDVLFLTTVQAIGRKLGFVT